MTSSWSVWVGPKSNDKWIRDMQRTDRRGGSNFTTETKTGVKQPQTKEHVEPPEAGRGKRQNLPKGFQMEPP